MPQAQTPLGNRPINPQQGYGFKEEPRPEYLRALDDVIVRLNDPRNMWIGVGMPWLYHGTSAIKAKNIIEKGFDPRRLGEMWGGAFGKQQGRSGPGVYFAESPEKALTWSTERHPALVRTFVPKKNILEVDKHRMPYPLRAEVTDAAKQQGYQAVKFPDETVVMDPTSIPLRNIRSFPGPSKDEQDYAKSLGPYLGFGE